MNFHHISVLPRETIDSLQIHPDGIYVDGTLGEEDMPLWSRKNWARRGV